VRRKLPVDAIERAASKKQTAQEDNRRNYLELRNAIFDAYGRKCVCCNESVPEFLSIDHINGGGNQERLKAGRGVRLWRILRKRGFPPGYRTLCYNCNNAIAYYKICPHALSAQAVPISNGPTTAGSILPRWATL
jgi:hypothetical protein